MPLAHPILPPLTVDDLDDARRVVDTLRAFLPEAAVVVADTGLRVRLMEGEVFGRPDLDPDGVVGRDVSDVLPTRTWKALAGQWRVALEGEVATLDWASLDGVSDYWVRFSPLCKPDGKVVGAVMIAQDITARWQAHRQLEQQVVRQAAIAKLGSLAMLATPSEDLMQEAARIVERTLRADVAAVLPYTVAGGLEIRAVSGETAIPAPSAGATDEPALIMEYMRDAEQPLLIGDLRFSRLRAPVLEADGMVSLIVAPIGPAGNRYGLFGACSRSADTFTEADLSFLQSMANALAGAVEIERSASEVRERAALLDEAQRLAGTGSWDLALDTGVLRASDHLLEMLSVDRPVTDMTGLFASVHDDDQTRWRQHLSEVRAAPVKPIEYRVVTPEGEVRHFRSQTMPITDDVGAITTLRGTVQDITDVRRGQETVLRSEERFRQGFDNAPIGMTLIDPATGRYLRVNEAYCRMVGRSSEELLSLTFAAVVHPDEAEQSTRQGYFEGDSEHMVTEARYLRPDGGVVWASVNSSRVMGPDGTVDVLFSQTVDITERRAREDEMRAELAQVAWVREIHAALAEDRFELHGQPIVEVATGEVVQHELLLRMRGTDGALIAPGEFLPAAEQYGAIRDIDRWVISRGAELAAGGMSVQINLSGTSMGDVGLIDEIDRALERTGAEPSRMVFEITETEVIENVDTARRLAHALRERGCRFALDDFGTGFAGISSLKTLPLDYLKIDRLFVSDLCVNETDRRVLAATLDLASAFGLQTIAEGVEDQQTLDLLRESGVDYVQGFFLGRPAPIRRTEAPARGGAPR